MPRRDIAPSSEPVHSDDDLTREINTEHGHVETHRHNTITHAIRCGELLLEMKQRVGHGNWLAWVEEQTIETTANSHIRMPPNTVPTS